MEEKILGLWSLYSWQIQMPKGDVINPYGDKPKGFLYYAADGFMSVSLAQGHREPLGRNPFLDMTAEEYKAMFEHYASYCGSYEIINDEVHHHIKMMSLVDWENTIKVRKFSFKDELLILSHELLYQDETVDSVLVWKRVDTMTL